MLTEFIRWSILIVPLVWVIALIVHATAMFVRWIAPQQSAIGTFRPPIAAIEIKPDDTPQLKAARHENAMHAPAAGKVSASTPDVVTLDSSYLEPAVGCPPLSPAPSASASSALHGNDDATDETPAGPASMCSDRIRYAGSRRFPIRIIERVRVAEPVAARWPTQSPESNTTA